MHTRLCVACAGVPVVYVWRYEHATLSTFACRAGPFSCRLTRHLRTTPDSMPLHNHLNVRPRSREFIEARVLRLLWDTCCHHAEARVHRVAASPSVRPGSQGRDLEVARSRPNGHLNTPQTRRRCLHTSTIKAHLPPCSPDAPEDPTRVQPPEGERI